MYIYSVLSAITGSFLAAIPLGMRPAMSVKIVDKTMSKMPCETIRLEKLETSIKFSIMMLIGKLSICATTTPKNPDASPMSSVSALKIREISFFLAPNYA